MSLSEIRDQPSAIRLLQRMLVTGRIPNAMMLWGPSGVGKGLAAFEFAKALNCTESDDDACGECLVCRKIDNGNHPDVAIVAPLKKSRIIDVDAIQNIVELSSLRPYESKWRTFIVRDADRMRAPAQNHFLKTLEEPSGNSVFLLVTEHPQFLLPTVRSRCQRIRFGALRPETIVDLMRREHTLDAEEAQSIAALSQGQMSRALDMVVSDKRAVVLDVLRNLVDGADPLSVAEEFGKYLKAHKSQIEHGADLAASEDGAGDGHAGGLDDFSKEDRERIAEERQAVVDALIQRDIMEHLYLIETWLRDKLVLDVTGDVEHVLNRDQVSILASASMTDLEGKIGAVQKARVQLERFLNQERVFRDLFFSLTK